MDDSRMKFKMIILKIDVIKAGSVLSGKVEKGEIRVGDAIEFEGVDGKQELEIKGIVDHDIREKVEKVGQDKNIGLFILEKNCEQIGLQEGMTIYMSEEGKKEDYSSDLFGDFEEKEIEESESSKRESLKNQVKVRVIVIYSDKLESISVNGVKMKDILAIENMPIPNWFAKTEDRNGWEGLITEIQKMLDDDRVDLSFEFYGPQESKYIFEECIFKRGFGNNEISKDAIAKENFEEAKRKEHRGLYNEAFKDYLQAADFGGLETAQFKVGEYYYAYCKGEGKIEFSLSREEAIAQAIKYYERSANQGNADAQYSLYTIFYEGIYVQKNYEESFKWGMMAAKQGHAGAEHGVAEAYQYGNGVNIDHKEAVKWYEKAVNQGVTETLTELESDYKFGNMNFSVNYEKGFVYDIQPGLKGDMAGWPFYRKGKEKNEEETLKWYRKAVEQGDADSEYALGKYYEYSGKNVKLAIEWYRKAAEQGHVDAQCKMGQYYDRWTNTNTTLSIVSRELDEEKSLEWYKKARDQGNAEAQYRYGKAYRHYSGNSDVNARHRIAETWIKKAADNKNPYMEACLDIADGHYAMMDKHGEKREEVLIRASMFAGPEAVSIALAGNEVVKSGKIKKFLRMDDGKEMIKYYRRAAELGSEKAKKRLKELEKYL